MPKAVGLSMAGTHFVRFVLITQVIQHQHFVNLLERIGTNAGAETDRTRTVLKLSLWMQLN
jgi:hypothetical protein